MAQWAPPCPGTYAWNRCTLTLNLPVCRKTRVPIVLKEEYIPNDVLELGRQDKCTRMAGTGLLHR